MNPIYDVVILGCGEAGIFAAYELASHRPELKVLALDQGRDIYHRSCPIVAGKVRECITAPCATPCAASAGRAPSPTESSTSPPSSAVAHRLYGAPA
ncbi:MAG: hypothetical protein ACLT5P_07230 [Flavonifractor plautii]